MSARQPRKEPDGEVGRLLRIRGVVQGVGFRWSLSGEAQRLGVKGWVRNRSDGSVEALACGDHEAVMRLLDWARRGPSGARVDEVLVEDSAERCADFRQLPTM